MNEDGKIIVTCPICRVPVIAHSAAELIEWWPRHCAVMPQCATGDIREMVEGLERGVKESDNFRDRMVKKMIGENK